MSSFLLHQQLCICLEYIHLAAEENTQLAHRCVEYPSGQTLQTISGRGSASKEVDQGKLEAILRLILWDFDN